MIIYKITNKINGKIYIGQTTGSILKRWSEHNRIKGCTALFNAIQKHGKENFTIEEIDGANSLSELNYLEEHYIYINNSLIPNGYNIKKGGNNHKFSQEIKNKISISCKDRIFSVEHRQKLKDAKLNKKSNNQNKNYSKRKINLEKQKRTSPTLETRLKISNSLIGKKHSEETKLKMSNKIFSLEHRKKLSEAAKKRRGIKYKK